MIVERIKTKYQQIKQYHRTSYEQILAQQIRNLINTAKIQLQNQQNISTYRTIKHITAIDNAMIKLCQQQNIQKYHIDQSDSTITRQQIFQEITQIIVINQFLQSQISPTHQQYHQILTNIKNNQKISKIINSIIDQNQQNIQMIEKQINQHYSNIQNFQLQKSNDKSIKKLIQQIRNGIFKLISSMGQKIVKFPKQIAAKLSYYLYK